LTAGHKNRRGAENELCKKTEQGDIFLTPYKFVGKTGFTGLPIAHITLSRMGCTILWFKELYMKKKTFALLGFVLFSVVSLYAISLNELRIIADDGTFLGTFENEYSSNSIYN
jgi:hypothetical protein